MNAPERRYRIMFGVVLLFFLLPLSVAHAHKLNIFAWPAKDKTIQGEAVFSGGRKAKNIKIIVQNAETNVVLLETVSDGQGGFHFTQPEQAVQEQMDLLIAGDAGEGHRGEWLLKAAEYITAPETDPPAVRKEKTTGAIDEELVRRIAVQEIDKKLAPVRQALAESRERKPELRDILGGMGCIVGLAGLFVWLQNRRKEKTGHVHSD